MAKIKFFGFSFLVVWFVLQLPLVTHSAEVSCLSPFLERNVLSEGISQEELGNHLKAIEGYLDLEPYLTDTLTSYFNLYQYKKFREALPADLVLPMFAHPQFRYYAKNFSEWMERLKNRDRYFLQEPLSLWFEELEKVLLYKVPKSQIPGRIQSFLRNPSSGTFVRALGELTLSEALFLLYGTDKKHPHPDSLIGLYLKESGASWKVQRFGKTYPPEQSPSSGGRNRIVFLVSEKSLPIYQKYFSGINWWAHFLHAQTVHQGKVFSYNSYYNTPLRVPGTLWTAFPHVALTTREGQRLALYFEVFKKYYKGSYSDGNIPMFPYSLTGENGNYCGKTGYTGNCTQWIGNIPLGDQLVDAYGFPVNYEAGGKREEVKFQKLNPFTASDQLLHRVYTIPGHAQFAEVIGQREANLNGEFANPGWVIVTLLGPTSSRRVPFVVLSHTDHKTPIPDGLKFHYERAY